MASSRLLVIGAGNPFAGDDAAGRLVAQALLAESACCDVVETTGDATDLVALFEDRSRVLIVDACQSDEAAGSVLKFDANLGQLPAFLNGVSSHGLGVAMGIELGRNLGLLPKWCQVYAISGDSFDIGANVSGAVASAVVEVVEEVRALGLSGGGI